MAHHFYKRGPLALCQSFLCFLYFPEAILLLSAYFSYTSCHVLN